MTDEEESDELRSSRCPRCGMFDPRRAEEVMENEYSPRAGAIRDCRVCGLGGVSRSPLRGGYWKRDLLEVVDELPTMGRPCFHCGARIPKFLDLERDYRGHLHELVRSGQEDAAVEEVMKAVGCPRAWAELWVHHPYGPRRPARMWVGPPCARCGRPLRTHLARQCLECGLDWHDPGEPSLVS